MEKCKKLRLKKRKTSSNNLQIKNNDLATNVTQFSEPPSPEVIDIDAEIPDKSTKQSGQEDIYNENRTHIDINDQNLRRLKELIQRVSSSDKGNDLLPFPSFIQNQSESPTSPKEPQLSNEQLAVMNDGFRPFPAQCKIRKKQSVTAAGLFLNKQRDRTPSNGRNEPTPQVQNCHLITDRNSNYYSLQSRNKNPGETNQSPTPSSSNVLTSYSPSLQRETSHAPTPSSSNVLHSISPSEQLRNHKEIHERSTVFGSSKSTSFLKSSRQSASSLSSAQVRQGKKSDRSARRFTETGNTIDLQNTNLHHDKRKDDCNIPKPGSSNSDEDFSLMNKVTTTNLQQCPLCQQEFAKSFTQMDVDSHIAKCLSNSEDDIIW